MICDGQVIQRAVRTHLGARKATASPFKLRQAASLHRPSAERPRGGGGGGGGVAAAKRPPHPPFPADSAGSLQVWVI
jgi:hypothetical protein